MATQPGITPVAADRIKVTLAALRIPCAQEIFDTILRQLERGEVTALEAIDTLLGEDLTLRESRRIRTALVMPRLSAPRTLAGFDFQLSLDRKRIMILAELKFIDCHEVVHFAGLPAQPSRAWRSPSASRRRRRGTVSTSLLSPIS